MKPGLAGATLVDGGHQQLRCVVAAEERVNDDLRLNEKRGVDRVCKIQDPFVAVLLVIRDEIYARSGKLMFYRINDFAHPAVISICDFRWIRSGIRNDYRGAVAKIQRSASKLHSGGPFGIDVQGDRISIIATTKTGQGNVTSPQVGGVYFGKGKARQRHQHRKAKELKHCNSV